MDRSTEASQNPQAPTHRGGAPLVIFAIDPHSYGQALGMTISHLRPALDVRVIKPKDLVAEMKRRTPTLVFCNGPRPEGDDEDVRWVQYRPYDDPDLIRVDGHPHEFSGLDLKDVLGLVDRLVAERRGNARMIHHNQHAV